MEHAKNLGIKRDRITEILATGERRKLKENIKTFQESANSLEIMSLTQQLKADSEVMVIGGNLDFVGYHPSRNSFNTMSQSNQNKPHISKNPLTRSKQSKFKPLDDLSLDINQIRLGSGMDRHTPEPDSDTPPRQRTVTSSKKRVDKTPIQVLDPHRILPIDKLREFAGDFD